jgi:hypothetical protein
MRAPRQQATDSSHAASGIVTMGCHHRSGGKADRASTLAFSVKIDPRETTR